MVSAAGELPSVSVVIPTVGRPVLAAVVRGCLEQAPLEVIVVADRDEAGVRRLLGSLTADPRLVVTAGAGAGPAAARQAGIERAVGDVVLLLDDDVVPGPGLVEGHARAHATTTGELVAGAVVMGHMPVAAAERQAAATALIYDNDYGGEIADLERGAPVLTQLWGGNVSLARRDALALPQANPAFPFDAREDQEYGLRAAAAGLRGRFVADLGASHRYTRSAARFLDLAAEQVRVAVTLRLLYPDSGPPPFRHPGGIVGLASRAAALPGLGRPATRAARALAGRYGDGPAARWRVGLVVVARSMVQADAAARG